MFYEDTKGEATLPAHTPNPSWPKSSSLRYSININTHLFRRVSVWLTRPLSIKHALQPHKLRQVLAHA